MAGTATRLLPADQDGIAMAVALLRQGRLVGFPTETVYGLGADACDPAAVAAIYAAKGRPPENPLIVHVADAAAARALGTFDPLADRLAAALWPGPLTLVLPLAPGAGLAGGVTGGRATVALRIPAHPVARALLAGFGGPVAAPSANPSGKLSPTVAGDVLAGLGGRIAAVIDGGACAIGLESTIVATSGMMLRLLRPGAIGPETLAAAAGAGVPLPARTGGGAPDRPEAPGQSASHYAPEAPMRLMADQPEPGEVWIGFGPGCEAADLTLSQAGDMAEAAARLFATLRAADALAGARGATIAVSPVPDRGIGTAINDRLRRAAAPRPGG